jgi:PAS domain-containing protein
MGERREPSATHFPRAHDSAFRWLLEVLPVAAYTCDPAGQITSFNQRAAELWGREPTLNDPLDRY